MRTNSGLVAPGGSLALLCNPGFPLFFQSAEERLEGKAWEESSSGVQGQRDSTGVSAAWRLNSASACLPGCPNNVCVDFAFRTSSFGV